MIPARYGSTRAKLKNLQTIGDKPMMAWAINAAKSSNRFDRIIVNGDNDVFKKVADKFDVEYYERPKELGSNETLIDDVLLDFVEKIDCKIAAIVNTINPFQTGTEVAKVIDFFIKNNLDSCNTYEEKFIHALINNNPINFTFGKLCRTQDLTPIKLLAYSVQVIRKDTFLREKNIFCGNFGLYGPISKNAAMLVKTDDDIKLCNAYYNTVINEHL